MKVFLTWSGSKSKRIAEILREWLPSVIQALEPWISTEDIEKGALWLPNLSERLRESRAAIICVTDSNVQVPWLNFEAGAISNRLEPSLACTFLVGVKPTDLIGPLAIFQATVPTRQDVRRLIGTLNKGLDGSSLEQKKLDRAFEAWWPELENLLNSLEPEEGPPKHERSDRELMEETLNIVRSMQKSTTINYLEHFVTGVGQAVTASTNFDLGGTFVASSGASSGSAPVVTSTVIGPKHKELIKLREAQKINQLDNSVQKNKPRED